MIYTRYLPTDYWWLPQAHVPTACSHGGARVYNNARANLIQRSNGSSVQQLCVVVIVVRRKQKVSIRTAYSHSKYSSSGAVFLFSFCGRASFLRANSEGAFNKPICSQYIVNSLNNMPTLYSIVLRPRAIIDRWHVVPGIIIVDTYTGDYNNNVRNHHNWLKSSGVYDLSTA